MATIAELAIRLIADTRQFVEAMEQTERQAGSFARKLGGQFSALGDSVLGFGAVAGKALLGIGTVAAATTAAIGGLAIKEAMEAEDALARVEAVIAAAGDRAGITVQETERLAMAYRDLAGGSDEAVLAAQAVLLRFQQLRGDAFEPALRSALDLAAVLGVDASQAALWLGRALEDPAGSMGILRRAGVMFTDEQEKLIKDMVKAGDIAGAQTYMLETLARVTGGTAARMSQTLSGRLQILRGHLEENAEVLGTALLPLFEKAVDWLKPLIDKLGTALPAFLERNVIPVVERLVGWFGRMWDAMSDAGVFSLEFREALLSILPPEVADKVTAFMDQMWRFLDPIIAFVKEHAEAFKGALIAIGAVLATAGIVSVLTAVGGAIVTVVTAIASPLGLLIGVVALLGAAWAGNWLGIRDKAAAVWAFLQPVFSALVDWLKVAIPAAIEFLKAVWQNVLLPAIEFVAGWLKNVVIPIWAAVADVIGAVVVKAFEVLVALWQNVVGPAVEALASWLSARLQPVMQALATFLRAVLGPAFEWLRRNVIDPVIRGFGGIVDAVSRVTSWLRTLADRLRNLTLPSWLTARSATPFEKGLVGIGEQLGTLARLQVPAFQASLEGMHMPAGFAHAGPGDAQHGMGPVTIEGGVHFNVPQGMNGKQLFEEFMREAAKRTREARASGAGTVGV